MSVKDVRGDVASLKKLSGTRAKDPSKQYAEADKLFTKIKVRAYVGPGRRGWRRLHAGGRGAVAVASSPPSLARPLRNGLRRARRLPPARRPYTKVARS